MTTRPRFMAPIGPWLRWYAWRPVDTVTHGWTWGQWVERRRLQSLPHLPGPMFQAWEYRPAAAREDG